MDQVVNISALTGQTASLFTRPFRTLTMQVAQNSGRKLGTVVDQLNKWENGAPSQAELGYFRMHIRYPHGLPNGLRGQRHAGRLGTVCFWSTRVLQYRDRTPFEEDLSLSKCGTEASIPTHPRATSCLASIVEEIIDPQAAGPHISHSRLIVA